jgi:hypothetical protein
VIRLTRDEVVRLIEQYRAGLEAEIAILHQLADLAARQRDSSRAADFAALEQTADVRDRLMRSLVRLEEDMRDVRHALTSQRDLAARVPGFDSVAALHREAAGMVNDILKTDQQSIAALADAELARRSAVASLERGETTLAAYRRVLAPPVTSALVDRRG